MPETVSTSEIVALTLVIIAIVFHSLNVRSAVQDRFYLPSGPNHDIKRIIIRQTVIVHALWIPLQTIFLWLIIGYSIRSTQVNQWNPITIAFIIIEAAVVGMGVYTWHTKNNILRKL